MKELDLDELHQAVNALMDEAGKTKGAKKEALKEDKPVAQPVTVKAAHQPAKPAAASTAPHLSIPSRKRGAAMDIVPPKPSTQPAPPSVRPSRTGPVLQPTHHMVVPPTPTSAAAGIEEPAEKPGLQVKPKEHVMPTLSPQPSAAEVKDEQPKPDASPHMVKPLSAATDGKDEDAENEPLLPATTEARMSPSATSRTAPAEPQSEAASDKSADEADAPEEVETGSASKPSLTAAPTEPSPFLTTKVEKRPLGAFTGSSSPAPEPQDDAEDEKEGEKSAGVAPPESIAAPSAAPAELSPELLAVESAEPKSYSVVPTAPLDQARSMSIPQQYQAPEKTAKSDMRPVFDTKEYHPPLHVETPPHQKQSRGHLVWLILLMILLGAAAFVAFLVFTGELSLESLPKLF